MLPIFLAAFLLAASTIWMHAAGISLLLRYPTRALSQPPTTPFAIRRTLLRVVWWLFLLHLAEIALWALFYLLRGYLSDAEAPSTSQELPTRPSAMAKSCLRSPADCSRRSRPSSASSCAACPWAISLSSSTGSFRGNRREVPQLPAEIKDNGPHEPANGSVRPDVLARRRGKYGVLSNSVAVGAFNPALSQKLT